MHRRMKQQHESTRAAVTGHDRDSRPRAHQRPNNALDEVDDEHGVCERDRRAARRSEGVLAERLNEGCQRQSQLPRICRQLHVRAARLASLSATAAHEHGRAREQGACKVARRRVQGVAGAEVRQRQRRHAGHGRRPWRPWWPGWREWKQPWPECGPRRLDCPAESACHARFLRMAHAADGSSSGWLTQGGSLTAFFLHLLLL